MIIVYIGLTFLAAWVLLGLYCIFDTYRPQPQPLHNEHVIDYYARQYAHQFIADTIAKEFAKCK